jgi:thymidylate synthase
MNFTLQIAIPLESSGHTAQNAINKIATALKRDPDEISKLWENPTTITFTVDNIDIHINTYNPDKESLF